MTLAEFNSLQPGVTTYRDAVSVVGCEGSVASKSVTSGYSTVMYTWTGSGSVGANANAMFQNDSLVTKAQFGLH